MTAQSHHKHVLTLSQLLTELQQSDTHSQLSKGSAIMLGDFVLDSVGPVGPARINRL